MRPGRRLAYVRPRLISIHASAWDATMDRLESLLSGLFQSTHPRGMRRDPRVDCLQKVRNFNPRIRVGCDPSKSISPACRFNFNPRIRVGCDRLSPFKTSYAAWLISIHASAWDATAARLIALGDVTGISIHASAWDATLPHASRLLSQCHFNPRIRVGCDVKKYKLLDPQYEFQSTHPRGMRREEVQAAGSAVRISIHASAWDATFKSYIA